MATGRKTADAKEKLTVAKRLPAIFIDKVTVKKNIKGTEYIATPYGAVYARINEIQPGLHTPVELSNGTKGEKMLALNAPTRQEVMAFITAQKDETGWSIGEIREFYGL